MFRNTLGLNGALYCALKKGTQGVGMRHVQGTGFKERKEVVYVYLREK